MDPNDNLHQWLSALQLAEYADNFKAFHINFDTLKFIDTAILKDIGVAKIGDRIKLEQEVQKLKDEHYVKLMNIDDMFKSLVQIKQPALRSLSLPSSSSTTLISNHKSEFKLNPPPQRNDKPLVSFILQNGSTVKINVSGCFNAVSIKKKLIKFLDLPLKNANGYDVYLTDSQGTLHLLFDVELVTICHSNDRIEKHRILFCPKNEKPSSMAIEVSTKYISMEPPKIDINDDASSTSRNQTYQDSKFRSIFGQRPTSQLISTNLSQYFPETKKDKLEKTIRNSVRYSVRMSTFGQNNKRLSTIGDFLVDSSSKVDRAILDTDTMDSLNLKSSMDQTKQRFSLASTITSSRPTSIIELFDVDTDSEDDHDHEDELITTSMNNVSLSSGSMHWLKGARIGSGSFGTVYLGMNSLTGELMAVKQVELKPLYDDSKGDTEKDKLIHQKIVESIQHEMRLLSELHHDNIVTYLGSSTDDNYINIFLEYVPGGSLNSMLTNYGPFEEPLIRNFTRQILIGLNYLHSKHIIHRDIKGANILIDIKGEVKISDFGISKKLTPSSKNDKRASLQGSVYWMAPEVVKQVATTTKADIWSVGCLIIEMFTGKHPFPNFSQMQAIFKIGTHTMPEIPKWCSEDARDFLQKTFILDYEKRPSATELMAHKFLDPTLATEP